jgi:hypothetical protein
MIKPKEVCKAPLGEDRVKASGTITQQKADSTPGASSGRTYDRPTSRRPEEPVIPGKLPGRLENESLPLGADPDTDGVMLQFQQLMGYFLETQKSIMMTYLQGTSHLPTSPSTTHFDKSQKQELQQEDLYRTRAQAKPAISPSQELRESGVQPTQGREESSPGIVPSDQKGFDEGRLCEELLRIASERTGYPKEMLSLDADMEADLGIDSIKRVEILGVFMECFPKEEKQKIQGILKELSRLKTLRAIVEKSSDVVLSGDLKSIPPETTHLSSGQVS